ncbi:hypothetical protein [Clostridium cavendishii]|nr:hypothetical protein [Clostridium cavendishii]
MQKEQAEVLKTANKYMDNLKIGINDAVELFQKGEISKGCSLIPDISKGIEWIIEVITLTKDVQTEEINISEIDKKFKEVVEAFENEDYILIGDLFNYEILPMLEDVHQKIKKVVSE